MSWKEPEQTRQDPVTLINERVLLLLPMVTSASLFDERFMFLLSKPQTLNPKSLIDERFERLFSRSRRKRHWL